MAGNAQTADGLKTLVIGYGSAGKRHVRILKALGCEVSVSSVHARMSAVKMHYDYAVIASRTSDHGYWLSEVHASAVLVEKPVFGMPQEKIVLGLRRTMVGYNLRFHPVIRELRRRIQNRKIYQAHFHVGQWLPDWRPDRDYRKTDINGVLRDLSHELDLMTWLCGRPTILGAVGGKLSDLDIGEDDCASFLAVCERVPQVLVSLNYLDKPPRRFIAMTTSDGTLLADLIGNTLKDGLETISFNVGSDDTYRDMHIAMMTGKDADLLCSLDEGVELVNLAALIESASGERRWLAA